MKNLYIYIIIFCIFFIKSNLISQNIINYQHDNLNRLKRIDYGNGTVIEYTYDAVGNRKTHIITSQQTTYSISGKITYFSNVNRAVRDVTVSLTGSGSYSQKSDALGNYQFTALTNGNYTSTPAKIGDYPAPAIMMYDASLAAQIAVSLIPNPSPDQKTAADVDENGMVMMYDASLIAMSAVGLPPNSSSHVGKWFFKPANRSYSPLNSNQTNQNFTAILLGDVDGNWSPPTQLAKASEENELITFLPDLWGMPGEKLILPIIAAQGENIVSCDIVVNYNSSILRYSELRTTALSENFQTVINNLETDKLRLGCFGVQPITEKGTYLEIIFEITGKIGDRSEFNLESYHINSEKERSGKANFFVGINPAELPKQYSLAQNYPNPFNPQTTINYELANVKPQHTTIQILNLRGELVKTLIDKVLLGGRYSIVWHGDDNKGGTVASGLYLVQLISGDYIKSIKMAKLK